MKQPSITRRVSAATTRTKGNVPPGDVRPKEAAKALTWLKQGNVRFVSGRLRHAHHAVNWRKHLEGSQQPFATILACSDSRVPPELVFDQGFGDLFVIRVAGNIVATDVLGSLQYATRHLHTPLVVVMGHESCGAVTAAVDALEGRAHGAAVHRRPRGRDRAGAQGPSRRPHGRRPRARGRRSQRALVDAPARGPSRESTGPEAQGQRGTLGGLGNLGCLRPDRFICIPFSVLLYSRRRTENNRWQTAGMFPWTRS